MAHARHTRLAGAALTVAALLFVAPLVAAPAAEAEPQLPQPGTPIVPVDEELMPRRAHGAEAVRMLGADGLRAAATRNETTADHLRSLLQRDPTAWVSSEGQLYYVEPAPADTATTTPSTTASTTATAAPLSDTFDLHSLPGAQRTVFLDFDGAKVSSTWANTQFSLPSTTEPGWDPAGNGSAFTDAELTRIQDVWARVAEDYAPFDVDVTTEQPSADTLGRSGDTDQTYGVTVIVGPSKDAWATLCSSGCGGIAPVGVFDDDELGSDGARYAWVFTGGLGDVSKYVADAAAHEAGHTFGLTHDGSATDPDYYAGTRLWGPIMGAPYASAVTQWSKGEYAGANNSQDDLAVIGARSTGPVRTDEAGGTVATAADLPDGTAYVTSAGDQDVFDLGTCTGSVSVRATPAAVAGPDLDIALALLGADGGVLSSADPVAAATGTGGQVSATGLSASLTTSLSSSRHLYVRVAAGSAGGWSTGYGSYGSVGPYRLDVSGCSTPTTAPEAPATLTVTPDAVDGTLTAAWTEPVRSGGSPITGYQVSLDGTAAKTVTLSSYRFDGVRPGSHRVTVRAANAIGTGPAATADVTLSAPPAPPGAVRDLRPAVSPATSTITLSWAAPADDGGSGVTGYRVHQYDARGTDLGAQSVPADTTEATLRPVSGGQTVRVGVTAVNAVGEGAVVRDAVTMPVIRAPAAPTLLGAGGGPRGGPATIHVRWRPPATTGGAALTGYRIRVEQLARRGPRVVRTTTSTVAAGRTSAQLTVRRGARYRLSVQAGNSAGWGPLSGRSAIVTGR